MQKEYSQPRVEAERICGEFPRHGNVTLAKILIERFPLLYSSLEHARDSVRRVRGKLDRAGGKSDAQPARSSNQFDGFPQSEYSKPKTVKIGACRALFMSDIHYVYQDNKALFAALDYGRRIDVDTIYINGDLLDFYGLSRFDKNPLMRSASDEIKDVRRFFVELRKMFPNQRIFFKEGNHEIRWEKYLFTHAPQLLGIEDFQLDKVLGLERIGVQFLRSNTLADFSGLLAIHGHEANINGGVNPARALYLRNGTSSICGHLHKTDMHLVPKPNGELVKCYTVGCLCGLWPDYARINKWNHGFAIIETTGRAFEVDNKIICGGKICQ